MESSYYNSHITVIIIASLMMVPDLSFLSQILAPHLHLCQPYLHLYINQAYLKTIIQIIYILSFLTLFTFKNESSYDYPPFVFTFCILSAHLPHKSVKTDHAYNFQVKKSLLDGFIFLNAKDNMVTGKHKPTTSYLHKLPNFEHFSYKCQIIKTCKHGSDSVKICTLQHKFQLHQTDYNSPDRERVEINYIDAINQT